MAPARATLSEKTKVRVQAEVKTESGTRLAVLETRPANVWFDQKTFEDCGGRDFKEASRGAGGADGKSLDVVGTGRVSFVLWGRLMRDVRVRVMRC
jgi:hypothetical protein